MTYQYLLFGIFYCYQNEIGIEKKGQKTFINYQKSEKLSHNNKAHDVSHCCQNRIKSRKCECRRVESQRFKDMKCSDKIENESSGEVKEPRVTNK